MRVGFVGGESYDAAEVATTLQGLPLTDIVVTGSSRGLEKFVREQSPEFGLTVYEPPLRRDLYDFPRPGAIKAGTPPEAPTRLMMLLRLDQAMFWGLRLAAENEGKKISNALDAQVTDVVAECLYGKLYVVGDGGRAKMAKAILKRSNEWPISWETL